MSTRQQPRRPAGTPVGGQFAPTAHDEADVELCDGPAQRRLQRSVAITRDDIMRSRDPKIDGHYCFTGDNGSWYDLLSFKNGEGFAVSKRTGLVVRVVKTGEKSHNHQVRARAVLPADTGDTAGTLMFDSKANGAISGRISSDLAWS